MSKHTQHSHSRRAHTEARQEKPNPKIQSDPISTGRAPGQPKKTRIERPPIATNRTGEDYKGTNGALNQS
ncbi:unnamed protein product [Dovyalis caffra]|uniref:Uncharacterized protein n=1 Tax=Dovyalis caffra TaxID=77055 RepID=A0AAV1RS05_9ROSI|nr:unnamed protein product [Dovyalis caffra]